MNILIVAATEEELKGARKISTAASLKMDFLVTGVGMTATTYALTKKISSSKYNLVINIGLAGSFRKEIEIGEVVTVVSDSFADLGAEDGEKFLSAFELGLMKKDSYPFWNGKLMCDTGEKYSSLSTLKKAKAITVNKVHGNETSIHKTFLKFQPDIESMEGAAFFYVCMLEKIPCLQLRAISNRVEKRNREEWNIVLAMDNLKTVLKNLLTELSNSK